MSRLLTGPQRLLLRAYPPSFRERYAAELAALVEDHPAGWTTGWDLARGAAHAWVFPPIGRDPRARLQTTVSTVFVAWCAELVALVGLARAVADPSVPGLHSSLAAACLAAMTAGFTASAATVAAAGAPCVVALVWRGLRSRQPRVWRPLAAPTGALALWLAATRLAGALLDPATDVPAHPRWRLLLAAGAFAAWAALGLACTVGCMAGAVIALRRSRPPARALRALALAASTTAAGLAVAAAGAVACVLALAATTRGPTTAVLLVSGALAAGTAVAAACAVASSIRGIAALRPCA